MGKVEAIEVKSFVIDDNYGNQVKVTENGQHEVELSVRGYSVNGAPGNASVVLSFDQFAALCDLRYRVNIKDPDERTCASCCRSWTAGQQESHYPDCAKKAEQGKAKVEFGVPPNGVETIWRLEPPQISAEVKTAAKEMISKAYWYGKHADDDVPF